MIVNINELLSTAGILLGVDFGDKRTGLAVSNRSRTIASGIGQISVGGIQRTAAAVADTAVERGVCGIVVGLPVNMDGSHGPRAEHAEKFARLLGERLAERLPAGTELPIVMQDERMTTMVAARYLNETDTRGQKRKGVIDTLSAEIILQDALDRLRYLSERATTPTAQDETDTEDPT